jgi:hypothetical protein
MTNRTLAGEHRATVAALLPRRRDGLSAIFLRIRVVVACDALDTALAQGADPARRPELAIRAAQLVRPGIAVRLPGHFRGVVAEASRPPIPIRSTAVVICRHQIRAQADDLLALADRLDSPRLAYATGIAIAQRLITDAVASPLHVARDAGTLGHLAQRAVAGMDDPTVHLSGGLEPNPSLS